MLNADLQMLAGDLAHLRVAELRREADADRLAAQRPRPRGGGRRSTLRRYARAAAAAIAWPIHH